MLFELLLLAASVMGSETGLEKDQDGPSAGKEFVFNRYPPRALAAGEQGQVKFRVEIDEKGSVTGCTVIGSSGYDRLDRETCDMMVEHAKFKPVLDRDGIARSAAHVGFVNWRIPGAGATTTVAQLASAPKEKVICKRTQKTGSLVSGSRVCMTATEWSRQADQYQEDWGAVQGKQGSTSGR